MNENFTSFSDFVIKEEKINANKLFSFFFYFAGFNQMKRSEDKQEEVLSRSYLAATHTLLHNVSATRSRSLIQATSRR